MTIHKNKQGQDGFTIVEVVLVLAIAGLIFAMVFIAYPTLRKSMDVRAVKNDISTVRAALESFKSTNRNKLPFQKQIEENNNSFVGHVSLTDQDCRPKNMANMRHRDIENSFRNHVSDTNIVKCVSLSASKTRPGQVSSMNFKKLPDEFNTVSVSIGSVCYSFRKGYEDQDYGYVYLKGGNSTGAYAIYTVLPDGVMYCEDNQGGMVSG